MALTVHRNGTHPKDWKFFGYGRLDAPIWFIGLEEHCGSEEFHILADTDARHRLTVLPTLPQVVDLAKACRLYGFPRVPSRVPVWDVARRTAEACGYSDLQPGAVNSDVCLLELLPLPTPGAREWLAEVYDDAFGYRRKTKYVRECRPPRVQRLRALLREHSPQLVVVHGKAAWAINDDVKPDEVIELKQTKSSKPVQIREVGRTTVLNTHNFGGAAGWSATGKEQFFELASRCVRAKTAS